MQLISGTTGEAVQSSPWLTLGKVYSVLELYVGSDGIAKFRIASDSGGTPALFRVSQIIGLVLTFAGMFAALALS